MTVSFTTKAFRLWKVTLVLLLGLAAAWVLARRTMSAPSPSRDREHAAVFGRVLQAKTSTPITGAFVELLFLGADAAPVRAASGTVDARGAFVFAEPHVDARARSERGVWALRASAPGFAVSGVRLEGQPPWSRDIVLSPATTPVSLRVRSVRGEPVSGAEIVLSFEPTAADPAHLALASGQSLPDGTFSATFAAGSGVIHYSAIVRGRGSVHGTAPKRVGEAPLVMDAVLVEGGRVHLEVVDPEQRHVEGAALHVSEVDGPWADHAVSHEGHAYITGVPRGRPLLVEARGDYLVIGGQPLGWTLQDPDGTLRVQVEPAGVIAGRVVDGQGLPVARCEVRVRPTDRAAARDAVTTTDDQGRFRIASLRRSTRWDIEARDARHAPAFREAISAGGGEVELTLHEGGALEGRVVDERGEGYPQVEVYAHRVEKTNKALVGLAEFAVVRTDERGAFVMRHLNAGRYRVEVRDPVRMAWSPVAAKVLEVEVREAESTPTTTTTLARGGKIRVMLAEARALTRGVTLSLLPDGRGGVPQVYRAQRSAEGWFEVGPVETGVYAIACHAAGHGFARSHSVRVTSGATTVATLMFEGASSLQATILDAQRQPVPGATVDVYRADGGSQSEHGLPGRAPDNFTGSRGVADAHGRVTLQDLSGGAYLAHVTSANGPPAVFTVMLAAGSSMVEWALPKPASLDVTLAGADAANKVVLLEGGQGAVVSTSGVTDARGIARFSRLAPGAYRVRAAVAGAPERSVTLSVGDTQALHLHVR